MPSGVLLLTGPPCSGKSSVGRLLAAGPARPGPILVEVDALFSLLLPHSDRNREDRMLAYDAAHRVARLVVEQGHPLVLECTYARRSQRVSLLAALRPETPVHVVEFVVSADEAVRRFRGRDQATDLDDASVRERVTAFPYSDRCFPVRPADGDPAELARLVTSWWQGGADPIDQREWAAAGTDWD